MRILIDAGHPAHVHIFKNLAGVMEKNGHQILFTCREKECTANLLNAYGLKFKSFGKPFLSRNGKIVGLLIFNLKMLKILLSFKPHLTISHSSMYAAQMSWLLGIPHISVEDTGNMEQIRLSLPFTKVVLVPDSFYKDLGRKQIKYKGNHELAYLHPSRFSPDKNIHLLLGIAYGQSYALIRFVSWTATHDYGHKGISLENKRKVVEEFSKYTKVFISSEKTLPDDLEKYHLKAPPEKMLDIIASASLLYGESATMASEAAVLGVPAIYLHNAKICYTEEEEKFGLVFNYSESLENQISSINKGIEILTTPELRKKWELKRQNFLANKIDVTSFWVWVIEHYPESIKIASAGKYF